MLSTNASSTRHFAIGNELVAVILNERIERRNHYVTFG